MPILKSRSSSPFQAEARRLGLSTKQVQILEPAATALFPEDPTAALGERDSFASIVEKTIHHDLQQLELTFHVAEHCASAFDALKFGRCSETPDPFRTVWVGAAGKDPLRGVVIPGREGEVAVFCPVKGDAPSDIGTDLDLTYRESDTDLTYELQLRDSVCLPGARILHPASRPTS